MLGVPTRVLRPIHRQIKDRSLEQLPLAQASWVLEYLIYVQWVRSAILAAIGGAMTVLGMSVHLGLARYAALFLGWITTQWNVYYMWALIVGRATLRRRSRREGPETPVGPSIPLSLRWGAALALVPAIVVSAVLL
jgi:hypothetical protein